MTRQEKILKHIDPQGQGIEIGPCHNPVTPKKAGYQVQIIDRLGREQLIQKYKNHSVDLEKIEEVDFVWQGETYAELTGKSKYYDWVTASHVIEHTTDLIGFLNDCDSLLKDDGVISLVIPDKRYCFDHYRPITGISKIIDSHFSKKNIHTPGSIAEHFLNAVSKQGCIAWDSSHAGNYSFVHTLQQVLDKMNAVLNENAFFDVHAWCFVPHSFRLIIHDLFCLGLIHLREVDFFQTEGFEFYMTLGRNGKGINLSRLEMLDIIDLEVKDINRH